MNSLRMSFCTVPRSSSVGTPCSSAATMYIAITGRIAPFMVMDTDTPPRSMLSNSWRMS